VIGRLPSSSNNPTLVTAKSGQSRQKVLHFNGHTVRETVLRSSAPFTRPHFIERSSTELVPSPVVRAYVRAAFQDVVPIGDPETWSEDPFGANIVERDGQEVMIGRGVSDMKGGIAAQVSRAPSLVTEFS
jgi:hypothetical protein